MNLRTFAEIIQQEVEEVISDVKEVENETTAEGSLGPEHFQGEITSKDGKFVTLRNELGAKTVLYNNVVPVSYEGNVQGTVLYFSFVSRSFLKLRGKKNKLA